MCMMCEEQAMYEMYLAYLAKKAQEPGAVLTPEESAFLKDSGFKPAGGFACDPAPTDEDAAPVAKAS